MKFLLPLFLLAGCTGSTAIKTQIKEITVPVTVPCILGEKPAETPSLKQRFNRDEWNKMSTDQREKLIGAQGLRHKVEAQELRSVTAGCN